MQADFDARLRILTKQACPHQLVEEVKRVLPETNHLQRWLESSSPLTMSELLMALYVCNNGVTLMCHDAGEFEEEEDAAVHILNKWQMFSKESLFEQKAKEGVPTDPELDLFEAELSALNCADDDFAQAGSN